MEVSPTKTIDVYLPEGSDWYAFGGGPMLKGGQVLKLRPALTEMPIYVRAGAIIPLSPGIHYASQTPDVRELHVHAGADGAFTLYDDAGDGHDYESGAFRKWPLNWDDKAHRLTFSAAEGTYGRESVSFAVTLHLVDGATRVQTVTVSPTITQEISL